MTKIDHTYYAARIAQEEMLARAAKCDASRIAHQRLADAYRSLVHERLPIAA
jgi:hypothetical protein